MTSEDIQLALISAGLAALVNSYSKDLQEEIDKNNKAYAEIAPRLRLYATDKIFNQFMNLSSFAKFAYAPGYGAQLIRNA